jgi:hypothetical protein
MSFSADANSPRRVEPHEKSSIFQNEYSGRKNDEKGMARM